MYVLNQRARACQDKLLLKQCARKSLGICFRCTREHSAGNALIVSAIGRRTPATVLGAPGWSCDWVSE